MKFYTTRMTLAQQNELQEKAERAMKRLMRGYARQINPTILLHGKEFKKGYGSRSPDRLWVTVCNWMMLPRTTQILRDAGYTVLVNHQDRWVQAVGKHTAVEVFPFKVGEVYETKHFCLLRISDTIVSIRSKANPFGVSAQIYLDPHEVYVKIHVHSLRLKGDGMIFQGTINTEHCLQDVRRLLLDALFVDDRLSRGLSARTFGVGKD